MTLLLALLGCTQPEPRWVRGTPNPVVPGMAEEPQQDVVNGSMVECDTIYAGPGQRWYTYEDNACQHGSSVSHLQLLPDESNGITCPLRWTGAVGDAFEHGFAGISTDVGLSNLGGYTRVILGVRGDGHTMRLRFPMFRQVTSGRENPDGCSSPDDDAYGAFFTCGDGSDEWKEVPVELSFLSQEGWGAPWLFDRNDIYQLQLQSVDKARGPFVCDFRILRLER